ncbi:MAG: ABC transporter substrate-binding protein [Burkholderiales bacterium]|nr:ABC transporter substrate-binding protein [Burkholderiales bacterium]
MDRRDAIAALLVLGATAGPLLKYSQAQALRKPYRIALLPDFTPSATHLLSLFAETLRESGRIEGRDFIFYRSGIFYGQDIERSVRLVVDEKPDLIFAINLGYAIAAHKLTKTIPIVMWMAGFPVVEGGVAQSLARPGKNVTGMTIYAGAQIFGKLVQLLHEAKPDIKRIGALFTYLPPFIPAEEAELIMKELRDAGRSLGIAVRILQIAKPEQTAGALAAVVAERMDALLLTSGVPIASHQKEIIQLALEKRLPTIADISMAWGGRPLLSYSASSDRLVRKAAAYANRILWEGAKPGDLPIQMPSKFELIVNLKTAKAIGLTVPQSLLLRADKVIE